MIYVVIHLIHIFSVFIYAGFLITDNLILMKMQKNLSQARYIEVRSYFQGYTRALVPKALVVAVVSGAYLFYVNFGIVIDDNLSNFQIMLLIKAFLGSWLGLRGVLQVFFGIQPILFKSHILPFVFIILIIFLSQFMAVI